MSEAEEGVKRFCIKCKTEVAKGVPFLNTPEGVIHQSCFSLGVCSGCGKEIDAANNFTEALGKKYHGGCFNCKVCAKPIQGGFINYNDAPHCKDCIDKLRSQQSAAVRGQCGICKQAIAGAAKALSFNNNMYHAECFVCYNCKAQFSGGVGEVNGNFYCPPCIQLKRNELQQQQQEYQQKLNLPVGQNAAPFCGGCSQPITSGKIVNVLSKHWHLDCLKCASCACSLADGKLVNHNNQPHCVACGQRLAQEQQQQQMQQQKLLEEQHNQLQEQRNQLAKQWEEFQRKSNPQSYAETIYETVDCSVCMAKVQGEYHELGGKAFCNDCAELVKRSLRTILFFVVFIHYVTIICRKMKKEEVKREKLLSSSPLIPLLLLL